MASSERGVTIETQPRERRRVTLPDGSLLYVNAETKLTVKHERRVELDRGGHRSTTDTSPLSRRFGRTVISTSRSSLVRKAMSLATEKVPDLFRINKETLGCLMPSISPACFCVSCRCLTIW